MRYGSVCSGIEAATVAWHPLGWQPVFFAQFDPDHDYKRGLDFPSRVLAHHYPEVPNLGDFTQITRDRIRDDIDLLVGGTPCQSFSIAGLRGGLDDDRGNLALEYLKLAQRLRPRWLVWENVPGVLSSNGGRDFGAILGGMVELWYGVAYRVLDAQFIRIHGYARAVPQRRRRVFAVGYLGDWRRAAAVLFERESLRGDSPPRREAGQATAPTLSARTKGGGGLGTDFDLDGGQTAVDVGHTLNAKGGAGRSDFETETLIAFSSKGSGNDVMEDCAPTMRAMNHSKSHANAGGQIAVAHALKGGGFDGSEDGTGRGVPLIAFDTTQITSGENRCNPQAGDPCHPIPAHGHAPAIAFNARQDPDISGAVTHPIDTDGQSIGVLARWRVRRLMPVECERLQGFPDGYTDVPRDGKPAADGPRYKALGNSMAIPPMRWIGQRLDIVERLTAEAEAA